MRLSQLLLFMPILWLAMGCAGNKRVGEGLLQKRQHQPGWHVDMGHRSHAPVAERPADGPVTPMQPTAMVPQVMAAPMAPLPSTASLNEVPAPVSMERPRRRSAVDPVSPDATAHVLSSAPHEDDYTGDRPRGPVNRLGLVALALVVGAIVAAFVSNSALLVAGIVLAGIVLAAIALKRIRSLEQRGKGFALVALILGLAAALLTLMMIVRTGW